MGFSHENVIFEKMDVICEELTGGEDHDGYPHQETIGIAVNQFGNFCIFKGTTANTGHEACTAVILSTQDTDKIADVLRALADSIQEEEN